MTGSVTTASRARWGTFAAVLVAVMVGGPLWLGAEHRRAALWITLACLAAALVVSGKAVSGYRWGLLIDSRNRVSLSRLQLLLWTVIGLGALLAGVLTNVAQGDRLPLDIYVPAGLWTLMGISTASMIGSPLIKQGARGRQDPNAQSAVKSVCASRSLDAGSVRADGALAVNVQPEQASWTDIVEGEQAANFKTIDVGKTQMLVITAVVAASYLAALSQLFRDVDVKYIGKLPEITDGMNVLLGISHAGYLSTKAIPQKSPPPAPFDGDAANAAAPGATRKGG